MTTYYNRKCFLFLQPMLTFASFFGMFPKYDFKTRKIVSSASRTVFVFALMSLIVPAVIYGLIKRAEVLYPLFNNKIMIFLDIFGDVLTTIWFVIACLDPHINAEVWENLFQQVENIEAQKAMRPEITVVSKIWNRPLIEFCIYNIFAICGSIGIIYVWSISGPVFDPRYFCAQLLLGYIEAIVAITAANFILMIYNKYEELNKILNPGMPIDETLLGHIRQTKMLYCLMDEMLGTFNKIFGKHILLVSLIVGCHILIYLVRIVHSVLGTLYLVKFGAAFVGKNVFSIAMSLCEEASVTFACSLAINESQKLLPTCYKLQEKLDINSEEYQALQNLITLVVNRRVKFTAADYFEVSKSTLFTLLSGAISYLIVVLQSQHSF